MRIPVTFINITMIKLICFICYFDQINMLPAKRKYSHNVVTSKMTYFFQIKHIVELNMIVMSYLFLLIMSYIFYYSPNYKGLKPTYFENKSLQFY